MGLGFQDRRLKQDGSVEGMDGVVLRAKVSLDGWMDGWIKT